MILSASFLHFHANRICITQILNLQAKHSNQSREIAIMQLTLVNLALLVANTHPRKLTKLS